MKILTVKELTQVARNTQLAMRLTPDKDSKKYNLYLTSYKLIEKRIEELKKEHHD